MKIKFLLTVGSLFAASLAMAQEYKIITTVESIVPAGIAFDETKLLNFFSIAGINFQNIASNDAVVSSKLSDMAREGWTLVFVTSGVESDGGKDDGNGIFITRYIFKR
jgi:hypothetical protein